VSTPLLNFHTSAALLALVLVVVVSGKQVVEETAGIGGK
jgi:hypothetical protein